MISKIDLINWKLNNRINPVTGRKIKESGKIYKNLNNTYNKTFKLDLSKIEDHIDIISQDRFLINVGNINKWVYKDFDQVIFYQEDDIIRVFTKTSLKYLKKHNIRLHPISGKNIPDAIFQDLNPIVEEKDNLNNLSKIFFQKLSNHSIFINNERYLELSFENINKLEYELKDFYYKNLSEEIRISIDKTDGTKLFKNKPDDINDLKMFILKEMTIILDNIKEEALIFSYYIIVGALSIVIPEVKKDYPNYSFSF
tara:strand:- start:3072 stop:3836 length:765 start_codon:yes stop_codon:yes gene_type:complete